MKKYTIKELAEYFNKDKEVIRRLIIKLNIDALNEHTRKHNNVAKLYDTNTLDLLKAEYQEPTKQAHASGTSQGASESVASAELISVLKEQLNKAQEQNDKLLILLQQEQKQRRLLNEKLDLTMIELKDADVEDTKEKENTNAEKKSLLDRIFKR